MRPPCGMAVHSREHGGGVLPVMRALVTGDVCFDIASIDRTAVEAMLAMGLGPVVAHVTSASPTAGACSCADEIVAAHLTAQVLTANGFNALEDALGAAAEVGSVPIL